MTVESEGPRSHARFRVVHCIPTLEQGGAERLLMDLAHRDAQFEHVIVKLCQGPHFFDDAVHVRMHDLGLPRNFQGALLLPVCAMRFIRLLRAERPAVVVGWLYYGALVATLAKLLRIPVVWSIHVAGADVSTFKSVTWAARSLCARLSRTVPSLVHYCAEEGREAHEADGFAAAKSRVVANGVDVARFAPSATTRNGRLPELEPALQEGLPLIGCIARFDPVKDHATLFAAAALLKQRGRNFRLVLAGEGCDRSNGGLLELIGRHGLARETVPLGAIKDIAALYPSLSVVTSASASEAMPLTVLEALASGRPAVVTDVGSNRSVVGHFGLIAPPRQPESLADLLERAVWLEPDIAHRAETGAASYVAANFSIAKCIASWASMLQEAIATVGPRR